MIAPQSSIHFKSFFFSSLFSINYTDECDANQRDKSKFKDKNQSASANTLKIYWGWSPENFFGKSGACPGNDLLFKNNVNLTEFQESRDSQTRVYPIINFFHWFLFCLSFQFNLGSTHSMSEIMKLYL